MAWERGKDIVALDLRLGVVIEKDHIDLGHLEAGDDEVLLDDFQLLEFELERLHVPASGLGQPVQGDSQQAKIIRAKMLDDSATELGDAERASGLPKRMPDDDAAFFVD